MINVIKLLLVLLTVEESFTNEDHFSSSGMGQSLQ